MTPLADVTHSVSADRTWIENEDGLLRTLLCRWLHSAMHTCCSTWPAGGEAVPILKTAKGIHISFINLRTYELSPALLSLPSPEPKRLDPANLTLLAVPPGPIDLPNTLVLRALGGARAGVALLTPPALNLRAKGVICGVNPSKMSVFSSPKSGLIEARGAGVVTR